MKTIPALPPGLATIASGRDFLVTEEFAKVVNLTSGSVRSKYSARGECFGIRPRKFGNRLLWPVAQIAVLLSDERN